MRINNYLDEVNDKLSSLKSLYSSHVITETFIPTHNLPEYIKIQKTMLYKKLEEICQLLKQDQTKYDDVYRNKLQKRKEYAQNAILKMETELDSKNIERIKNLKSQIDFLKHQGNVSFNKLNISHEDSKNIFAFLNTLELSDEYEWMSDFLQRKISFDIKMPTIREIENIKKMLGILKIQ